MVFSGATVFVSGLRVRLNAFREILHQSPKWLKSIYIFSTKYEEGVNFQNSESRMVTYGF